MSAQRVIAVMVVMARGQSFEVVPAPPHWGSGWGQMEVEGSRRLQFYRDQYIRSYEICSERDGNTNTLAHMYPVSPPSMPSHQLDKSNTASASQDVLDARQTAGKRETPHPKRQR
ncbi:hypothetical protein LTR12_004053 [Friedmanniomyces endolithicus]|nr:hypothetical protein LTR12_004053 [Friedmanniomyces endolithicus]